MTFQRRPSRHPLCALSALSALLIVVGTLSGLPARAQTTESFVSPTTGTPWTVPDRVTSITVDIRGAGGGAGGVGSPGSATGADGGDGGRLQATIAVTPGQVLVLRVGGGGSAGTSNVSGGGGGGGGYSGIFDGATPLVIAAGGGGGAGGDETNAGDAPPGAGGDGGAETGGDGGGGAAAGLGGTQTAGGERGIDIIPDGYRSSGSSLQGGNGGTIPNPQGFNYTGGGPGGTNGGGPGGPGTLITIVGGGVGGGGGGGGGYFGGGGGAPIGNFGPGSSGGGGGGSNFAATAGVTAVSSVRSGGGAGGSGAATAPGGNGSIAISYIVPVPGVTVTQSGGTTTVAENGGTDTFTVALDARPTADVTISVASSDTTAATVSPASLEFTPANWATPQTVTVTGVNDDIANVPDRTAQATFTVVSTDAAYGGIAVAPVAITVVNDDAPGPSEDEVRDAFDEVTGAFISRRMDQILSHEPESHRLDRRRLGGARPELALRANGPDISLSFSGSHVGGDGRWHVWAEGRYAMYRDSTGALGTRDGDFGILHIGADWLVNARLALGLMVQADTAGEQIAGLSDVSGNGWMAGPYISAELRPDLFLTARAAWGRSSNDAAVDVLGTPFAGAFDTERALVRARLDGRVEWGDGIRITPSAELSWMRERQEDYSVTDGVVTVDIDGRTFEIGRLSLTAGFEWPTEMGGTSAVVFATPRLDWNFHTNGAADTLESTRGGIELGLRTGVDAGWRGEVAVRYDGIGSRGFEALSARALVELRF